MENIVARTETFLNTWKITPDAVDMDTCCSKFLKEMERGLNKKGSGSLAMIPTYISPKATIEVNRPVIVVDAGGTNLRTCLVSFDDQLHPHISSFRKTTMPGAKEEVSAKAFFSLLADQVEPLIEESEVIGFCFSYAAEITADHDGIPLVFSKEIKAKEVIGMPIGRSLLDELARRHHTVSRKRLVVLNDTVATLLAGKAFPSSVPYDGYVGFILGTGTNTAYVERNSEIKKLDNLGEGEQIINVESGNYDLAIGDLDRRFFSTTENPAAYHFEKMISGAYLGAFCHLVLQQAIEEGLFSSRFAQRFSTLEPLNTTRMSNYLEMPHNKDYDLVSCVATEKDACALYLIIDAIIARAAKLTAVNLSAAVIKSRKGNNPRYPVCINADGTTYYKTENLSRYTEYYLYSYLQRKRHRYTRIVHIADSPLLGAAVAGLSLA